MLGAGNIASIAPLDVLSKLYADGEVVVCKLNPINDYLGPLFSRAFRPLIDDGFLRFVSGAAEVGSYLCAHPGVHSVHITGSAQTHDVIVYGTGAAGAERKARDAPLLTKPITSELGGVGSTIVVPGPWTDADLAYQAEHVVTQKLHNSGHNCIASQVLVLPEFWPQTAELLAAVRRTLTDVDPRPAYYYSGSEQRREAAIAHYPQAEVLPAGAASSVLIEGVDSTDSAAYAFTEEFFGPVLATTSLPGADAADFLRRAVAFCNDTLHGTLGANIAIHPSTAADLGSVLDEAVADLRYGTVAVNAWTGVGYLTPRATWGAFPGHRLADIGSGMGVVHNALLLNRPQKTVVRGPFAPFPRSWRGRQFTLAPRPPWFVTNRTAATTGRRLTRFAADGRMRHLPGIFAAALRG
ncbi:MAG: aldehyde dehydrogenase family protein [Frankiaceae bacterium]